MNGSSLLCVTNLSSLVVIGTVVVLLVYHMMQHDHVINGSCDYKDKSPSK